MTQEGGNVTYLDANSSQMGKKESLEDSAKVLGRFFDGIEYRGYEQSYVECLAKHSGVPVFNGLTDVDHPTQILADMMTIEEHCSKPLRDVKVVFPGDIRNNMCYAWMYGCAKMGMHFVGYGPSSLKVDEEVMRRTMEIAKQTGAKIEITDNENCLKGADVIYCDIWASMGEEDLIPERAKLLSPYKVDDEMLKKTGNPNVLFMHCLPSFHDLETTLAKQWMEKGRIVVLTTQVENEGSDLGVYHVGYRLKSDLKVLEAYDMTTEAVVAKLMWLLGQTRDRREIEKRFYTPVAKDILWEQIH